jgi:hypothetical protein
MGEDHAQIMKLQTQSTALQRKTEAETQRLNEMIALARQVEKKIHEQRSDRDRVRSGGVYASKTTTLRATLVNGQLETRRAGLNRKAAQMDMINTNIRHEIDSHRKKLVLYDKVYERLNKELESENRAKRRLIEKSNDSFMEHEDAKRQCERLELINEKEQIECDRLCEEALAMIQRQNEARDFVDSVTQKKIDEQKKAANEEQLAALEEEVEKKEGTEHVLKSRLRDLKRGAAAQEAHIRSIDLQLLNAEQAFTRLRKVSGLKSTAAVVAAFVANEDENFSLFNFIQETNDEVTRQQESVDKIQRDMARFQREKEMKSEHAYSIINSLKSKRTNAEDRTYQIKSQLAEARLELLQLCTGVSQMFSHIGCSWEVDDTSAVAAEDATGSSSGAPGSSGSGPPPGTANSAATNVTNIPEVPEGGAKPNNILMYIGMIEQRATEIIQNYVRLQNQKTFGNTNDDRKFTFVNPFGPPHPHDATFSASTHMKSVPRPELSEARQDLQAVLQSKTADGKRDMVRPLSRFELTSRVMQTMGSNLGVEKRKKGSVSLPQLR